MKETFFNIIKTIVLLGLIAGLFYLNNMVTIDGGDSIKTANPNLTIYGDNIDSSYQPYVNNGKTYISTKTIGTFIDDNILFDNAAQKVIITTDERTAGEYKIICIVLFARLRVDMRTASRRHMITSGTKHPTVNIAVAFIEFQKSGLDNIFM